MVQLVVLAGCEAGKTAVVNRFPFRVGRGPANLLVLSDPGVFTDHFQVAFTSEGFLLSVQSEATLTLNGAASMGGILRNGDIIGAGLAKIQFWLGELPQRGLKAREFFTWFLLAAVLGLQFYCFARLLEIAR